MPFEFHSREKKTYRIYFHKVNCHHKNLLSSLFSSFLSLSMDCNMSSSVWSVAFDISHLLNNTATSNATMAHASTNNLACSYSDAHKSLQWQKHFMWICCYLFSVFWINFHHCQPTWEFVLLRFCDFSGEDTCSDRRPLPTFQFRIGL